MGYQGNYLLPAPAVVLFAFFVACSRLGSQSVGTDRKEARDERGA